MHQFHSPDYLFTGNQGTAKQSKQSKPYIHHSSYLFWDNHSLSLDDTVFKGVNQ